GAGPDGRAPHPRETTAAQRASLLLLPLLDDRIALLHRYRRQSKRRLHAQPGEEILQVEKAQRRDETREKRKHRKQPAISQRRRIGGHVVAAEFLEGTLEQGKGPDTAGVQHGHRYSPQTVKCAV